jgi:putative SOS response-associated peptidase YedK
MKKETIRLKSKILTITNKKTVEENMCGRFVQKSDLRKIALLFQIPIVESQVSPSYNITPSQPIAVIMEKGQKKIVTMKWGLVPHWAKDDKNASKLINGRAETIIEKPSFKDSFKKRRCLILADGFYEWQGTGITKKPFYISMKDDSVFCMAGLYDVWTNPEGEKVTTCTIVTTEPNEIMKPIHHRMPVIVNVNDYDLWLNVETANDSAILKLLKPCDSKLLKAYEVGVGVNNPKNNTVECIDPVERMQN